MGLQGVEAGAGSSPPCPAWHGLGRTSHPLLGHAGPLLSPGLGFPIWFEILMIGGEAFCPTSAEAGKLRHRPAPPSLPGVGLPSPWPLPRPPPSLTAAPFLHLHAQVHPHPHGRPQPEDQGGDGAVHQLGPGLRPPRLQPHHPRQRHHAAEAPEARALHRPRPACGPPQEMPAAQHRVHRVGLGQHQQP